MTLSIWLFPILTTTCAMTSPNVTSTTFPSSWFRADMGMSKDVTDRNHLRNRDFWSPSTGLQRTRAPRAMGPAFSTVTKKLHIERSRRPGRLLPFSQTWLNSLKDECSGKSEGTARILFGIRSSFSTIRPGLSINHSGSVSFIGMAGRSVVNITRENGQPRWIAYFGMQFLLGLQDHATQ